MSKRPVVGLNFPVDGKGGRSSTAVNQGAFAAAVEPVDKTLAEKVRKQKGWRFKYINHLVKQVEVSAQSEANALTVASAGLKYLHSQFEFIRDGKTTSLTDAMKNLKPEAFDTVTIKGTKAKAASTEFTVPYHGTKLTGDALVLQIETWVRKGVIEFSCGEALLKVARTGEWLDLSDKYFVLLGATSAMGPLPLLLSLGANIIAIDIPRPFIWKKLLSMTEASSGSITFPVSSARRAAGTPSGETWSAEDEKKFAKYSKLDYNKQTAEVQAFLAAAYHNYAGCDLLAETPEIRNWLASVHKGKPVLIGAYAYLDGPLFFRLSMGMDAIIQDLTTPGGPYYRKDTALAYLCTPTDTHVVPASSATQARAELRRAPLWQKLGAALLAMTKFRMSPNARKPVTNTDTGDDMYVCNATVGDQGPNYILAKRLQHWRAMTARKAGCIVSSNIAPATATASVVSNVLFKLAYEGMGYFKPLEVFQADTSNAVMGGLLLNDIQNVDSASHPSTKLTNPLNLFTETSFHGGAWRCAYNYGSVGFMSVIAYMVTGFLVTGYLALYNAAQAVGWGYSLSLVVQHIASGSSASLWVSAGYPVYTLTMLTFLEVVHSLLGFVRAPWTTTFVQVLSRILLAAVCNVMCASSTACTGAITSTSPAMWLTMMCFAWSLTEVVRYSFYFFNLFKIDVKPLTWLRYSLFTVLYPMGVSGEIGCLLAATSAGLLGSSDPIPASAPFLMKNIFMPVFQIVPTWLLIGVAYGGGLPTLYLHMLAQRKKVLGGGKKVSKGKKTN